MSIWQVAQQAAAQIQESAMALNQEVENSKAHRAAQVMKELLDTVAVLAVELSNLDPACRIEFSQNMKDLRAIAVGLEEKAQQTAKARNAPSPEPAKPTPPPSKKK